MMKCPECGAKYKNAGVFENGTIADTKCQHKFNCTANPDDYVIAKPMRNCTHCHQPFLIDELKDGKCQPCEDAMKRYIIGKES